MLGHFVCSWHVGNTPNVGQVGQVGHTLSGRHIGGAGHTQSGHTIAGAGASLHAGGGICEAMLAAKYAPKYTKTRQHTKITHNLP